MFEYVKQWQNCIFNIRPEFFVNICPNFRHSWVRNVSRRSNAFNGSSQFKCSDFFPFRRDQQYHRFIVSIFTKRQRTNLNLRWKWVKLSVIELEENWIDALIGFHWLRMIVRIPFSEKVEKMTRSIKL